MGLIIIPHGLPNVLVIYFVAVNKDFERSIVKINLLALLITDYPLPNDQHYLNSRSEFELSEPEKDENSVYSHILMDTRFTKLANFHVYRYLETQPKLH